MVDRRFRLWQFQAQNRKFRNRPVDGYWLRGGFPHPRLPILRPFQADQSSEAGR